MALTVYSSCSFPFTTGCFLFSDSGLTTPVANGIYSDGTSTFTVSGGAGEVTSIGSCGGSGTSTTTTTTTLFTNIQFDMNPSGGGYTIGGIDVNSVTPTLTGGTDVPFSTDNHFYNTDQIGTNETINIFVSAFSLNGCITVTDSASNVFTQNITATGTYSFTGLTINNSVAVTIVGADNLC